MNLSRSAYVEYTDRLHKEKYTYGRHHQYTNKQHEQRCIHHQGALSGHHWGLFAVAASIQLMAGGCLALAA